MKKNYVMLTALFFSLISITLSYAEEAVIEAPKVYGFTQVHLDYLKPDSDKDAYTVGFQVNNARFGAKGTMFKELVSYDIVLELVGKSKAIEDIQDSLSLGKNYTFANLLDYYVIINHCKYMQIKVGQYKVPFTRQYYQSSNKYQFADLAYPVTKLNNGRDIGVELFSTDINSGMFEYHLGFFNGNGNNMKANDNTDVEVAGKVAYKWNGFNPLSEAFFASKPGFALGVSGYSNHLGLTATSQEKVGMGVDATGGVKGLFVTGEYLSVKTTVGDKDLTANGLYAQAGYMIIPKTFEVMGRYSQYDPNTDAEKDAISELRGGLAYYFSEHNHKISVEFGQQKEEKGYKGEKDVTSNTMTAQYQMCFK